jgi:hypothetical protein
MGRRDSFYGNSGLHSEPGRLRARIVACASNRRLLQDNVSSVFQMPRDTVGGYPGRELVAVVHALSPVKYKGERDGVSKIATIGGRELGVVGHPRTIADG